MKYLLLFLIAGAFQVQAEESVIAIGIRNPSVVTVVAFEPTQQSGKNSLVSALEKANSSSQERIDAMEREYSANLQLSELQEQTKLLRKIADK